MSRAAKSCFYNVSRRLSRVFARRLVSRCLLAGLLIAGVAGYSSAQPDSGANAARERIHFGDLVDVDFVGSLEFDWRGGMNREGFLDGLERADKPVYALCRTEAEVAAAIEDRHRHFLRDPKVVVRIVDRSNRALAFITGAVRTPQRLQLRRAVSLQELIVLSGGVTDASNGEIVIFRPPNVSCSGSAAAGNQPVSLSSAGPRRTSVKIADLLAGDPDANPTVVSGDVVNVVEAPPVFLIGDVVAPKRMNLTPDLTLSRAIASAGGAARSFSGQKARVYRRGPDAKILEYDLRRIVESKEEDPTLQAYDVIEVEQRGSTPKKVLPIPDPPGADGGRMLKLPLRIVD